ncbi:MAG: TetR/AcrR family transcriptional regulator [Actinobacteria bacterium]|nr:TetR/AcrR family transcriptional regulator [Actinomycetota bacterium]
MPDSPTARAVPVHTRDRLVAAATELIMQDGYAAACVAAVAERSGVATGTLYRHFPSKAALFVEVFRRICGRELEVMREAAEAQTTATSALDAIVESFASRALQRPRLAWALLSEPADPLVDAERLTYRRKDRELIAEVVRGGVESGEFVEQDADASAAALVGAIGDALIGPLSSTGQSHADPARTVAELQAFCRRAVGVPSPA